MLRQRVLSALFFIPILFVSIWFGDPWFSVVVAVAALLGVVEFYDMFAQKRWQPLTLFGTLWTLFFVFNAHYVHSYDSETTQLLVTSALVSSAVIVSLLCSLFLRASADRALFAWAWSLAGVLYMGWLLSYWILLMNSAEWVGRDWVLLALFSTFAFDTTAYFVGRAFGKHKMSPATA